jgi:hypothetical protein
MTLHAGVSEIEITPAPGWPLDGYAARQGVSSGTHDPLLAQVLVLAAGDRRAAIVAFDVLAVSGAFALPLRQEIARVLGTEADAVMVCASHTHCGPAGVQNWFPPGGAPAVDAALAAFITRRVIAAAQQAAHQPQPVTLSYRTGTVSGVGGDRNWPGQAADSQVTVLQFSLLDGAPLAAVFHYACHPTILGPNTLVYSADFPGVVRRRWREAHPDSVCLYLNGAAGDISTRDFRREQTFAEVERLGGLLAQQALDLPEMPVRAGVGLDWGSDTVELPLRALDAVPPPVTVCSGDRRAQTRAEGTAIAAQLGAAFGSRAVIPATLNVLHVGDWALLGVPGEPFSALAAQMRAVSERALVTGYANDYLGYFPTQQAIDASTYEALSSPYDARALALIAARLTNLV